MMLIKIIQKFLERNNAILIIEVEAAWRGGGGGEGGGRWSSRKLEWHCI